MPGIAFSSSEKRNTPRAKRWKTITIFHRPSSMRSAASTPRAAMSGVTSSSLPVGKYPTFLCVLAIRTVWHQIWAYPNRPTPELPVSLDLPIILRRYFEAQNAHDVEAMVACFAPDAAVRDEG